MSNRHVAIVGYAFRLPGTTTETFWDDLCAGKDLVGAVAADRWDSQAFLHPRASEPGCTYTFAAGSIGDVSRFDADFFGISPREAAQMDPQQRLLLEFGWEAFEDAGIKPSSMRGSDCGVYLGLSSIDYAYRRLDDLASIDASTMTGNTASIAANRISYWFDLKGPSVAVDTACSSALVAFHLACRAIASGECSHAVAGGISLHLHPFGFIGFSKASMLSRRGRCRVFDAAGDGYVRSEGGGMFLLKNLQDALADGDPIRAVVAATGTNCDGRTNGLTVPSADAQTALLTEVYGRAGIPATEVDYLEAHGTGTAVGDPIEAEAIARALGQARPTSSPLLIGSVKSNLGHLEAASGVAGLVKALHCLRHRTVPPSIHLHTPNPHIPFEESNLKVVTATTALARDGRLTIGVNSFGFGGANAHVILESADAEQRTATGRNPQQAPLLLSGRNEAALKANARAYVNYLDRVPGPNYPNIAYSAALHRDWHDHRLIAFGAEVEAIRRSLTAYCDGESTESLSVGTALPKASRPAFVFSGNGSQWAGMGRTLIQQDRVFRETVQAVDELFARYGDFSIAAELLSENGAERMNLTEVAQPALFAIQVGLTTLLQQRGLTPAAVTGHSVGEVAAAWASGALSLEQAVQVVAIRSQAQAATRGQGGMTAVGLNAAEVGAVLAGLGAEGSLHIAGFNSPRGVTVAGDFSGLGRLEAALTEREIFFRRLGFDYAFHSPAMDPIAPEVKRALIDLQPHKARIPFYSTVTGSQISGTRLNATYWWQNIREPVRFDSAINALIARGINVFVEVGPHAVLRNYVSDCLRHQSQRGAVIPTMLRGDDRPGRIQDAFFQVLIAGSPYDAHRLFPFKGARVDLPRYPWQRERHWHSGSPGINTLISRRLDHPMLGYRLGDADTRWENQLDTSAHPALADHAVGDTTVFPAAGFAEMGLAAAMLNVPGSLCELEDLEILAPLLLTAERSKTIQFELDGTDGSFFIRSRDRLSDQPWLRNARGRILHAPHTRAEGKRCAFPARAPDLSADEHYRLADAAGLRYGPAFRTVQSVWLDGAQAWATLRTGGRPADDSPPIHQLDPTLLDGCFQLLVGLMMHESAQTVPVAFVPVKIQRLLLLQPGVAPAWAQARLVGRTPRSVRADFRLFDAAGRCVATLSGVRFRGVPVSEPATGQPIQHLRFRAIPRQREFLPSTLPDDDVWIGELKSRLHSQSRLDRRNIYYREVEPLLDVLCASCAERGLRRLSGNSAAFAIGGLIDSGVVSAGHESLLHRMVEILQEDGLIEPTDDGWRWTADSELPPPEAIWISLISDYPDHAGEMIPIGRIGIHLADALTARSHTLASTDGGPRDPFGLIGAARTDLSRTLDAAVHAILDALPDTQRPRLLEWTSSEAGTGRHVLAGIDRDRCECWWASPRDGSGERVSERGDARYRLRTCILDLDQPDARTLAELQHTFDLIIIREGVARFRDPENTLNHLHSLLTPGGRLLFIEDHPSRTADLIFGLDSQWWRSGRRSPLLAPRQWRSLFERLGWVTCHVVADSPGFDAGPFIVMATANEHSRPLSPATAGSWLIFEDHQGYSAALAASVSSELRARGQHVISVRPAGHFQSHDDGSYSLDPDQSAQFEELFSAVREAHGEVGNFVHLYGLEPRRNISQPALDQPLRRCQSLARILQASDGPDTLSACWLITQSGASHLLPESERRRLLPQATVSDAATWGFGRTVMNEYPELNLRLIDLAEPDQLERMSTALLGELLAPDGEDEILLTGSGRYVTRLEHVADEHRPPSLTPAAPTPDLRLDFTHPGQLRSLAWHRYELNPLRPDEITVAVRAAGLNFRDIMYAMGLLSDEAIEGGFAGPGLGMELSGVVTAIGADVTELRAGDEVVAFAPWSFGNRVITKAVAAIRKPEAWSFEAAATIPIAYFTVYYAFQHLARLREGEKVLIHGAAGGVGIAAIQLAKVIGAEIYATAGSAEKRDFLKMLGVEYVLDSRSLAFADEILELTSGRGVDVVLNSLAGEAINRNLRVLKPFGRFLELGKRDFYENTKIGLRPFRNNIAYFGIDADQLMIERPELTRQLFLELMEMFEQGALKPLPYRAFAASDAVDAFRYMQQSRHIGKIVLRFDEPLRDFVEQPQPERRLSLNSDGCYLITGGLSGLGLEAAQWLAQRGARHLVLVSREGRIPQESAATIAAMEALGATVNASACDITDRGALAGLVADIKREGPPLRGVIHAAAVYDDGLVRTVTAQQLQRVLAPKLTGALHLFELTRECPLDFIVLFSSATTLFGNPGQAAYVAANHFLEALAEQQRAAGRPAFCIGFGPVGDAGYLAEKVAIRQGLEARLGGAALAACEAMDALEQMLLSRHSGIGRLRFDWRALSRLLPSAQAPKFEPIALAADAGVEDGSEQEDIQRWLSDLNDEELTPLLLGLLKKEVASILQISPERLEDHRSIHELGMDSLMGMELITAVETRFGVKLPIMSLSEGPTLTRLVERIIRQLRTASGSPQDTDDAISTLTAQYAAELKPEHAAELRRGISERIDQPANSSSSHP